MRVLNVILSADGRSVQLWAEGERQEGDPSLPDDTIDKGPRTLTTTDPKELFSALFNLPRYGEALYQGPWRLRFLPRNDGDDVHSNYWKIVHPDDGSPLFRRGWTLAEVHRPPLRGTLPGAEIDVLGGGEVWDALLRAFPDRAQSVPVARQAMALRPNSIVVVTDPSLCASAAEIQRVQEEAAQSKCPMIVWCIADTPRARPPFKPRRVEISPTGFCHTTMAWYADWLPQFLRKLDGGTPLEEAFAATCADSTPPAGSPPVAARLPPLKLQNTCSPDAAISRTVPAITAIERDAGPAPGPLWIPIKWEACIDRHDEEKAVVQILKDQAGRSKASVHVAVCHGEDKDLLDHFVARLKKPPMHRSSLHIADWEILPYAEGSPPVQEVMERVNDDKRPPKAAGSVFSILHEVETVESQLDIDKVQLYLSGLRDAAASFRRSVVVLLPLHCPPKRWLGVWPTNRWTSRVEALSVSIADGAAAPFSYTKIHLKDGPLASGKKRTQEERKEIEERWVKEIIESVQELRVPLTATHQGRLRELKKKSLRSILTLLEKELGTELRKLQRITP